MIDVGLVEIESPVTILEEGGSFTLTEVDSLAMLEVPELEILAVESDEIEIITEGIQGPPGPPGASSGTAEDEMPYAERIDIVNDSLIYKAQANPGTSDSAALWRIRRLTIGIDGDVVTQWADGNANFDNVWTNRASLNYV